MARAKGRAESLNTVAHSNGHAETDEEEFSVACGFASREPDPAERAESNELSGMLRRLVEELPENQREAVDLWAEGFSHQQIGEIIRRSEGNARVLVHRALTRLRNHPRVKDLLDDTKVAGTLRVP